MRYPYTGVFVDHSGNIVSAGTISVFLQDTGGAANIYTASSGGAAVNSVTSDSHGIFTFWVDGSAYRRDQEFKLILSKTGFIEQTYEHTVIPHTVYDSELDVREFLPYGFVTDASVDYGTEIQSAFDYAITNDLDIYLHDIYASAAKLTLVRPFNDTKGVRMYGRGRGVSGLKYIGSASIGTLLDLDGTTSGYTLNNHLHSFKLDITSAPTGTIGLKINAGVWRSRFENLYTTRNVPGGGRTGTGIYMGSATGGDVGCFDNKFNYLYVNNFSKNLHFQGTDLSGNTITNCPIDHSYISNGDYNLYAEYFNGLSANCTQYENAQTAGAHFINGETYVHMGGTIESPVAGAKGVTMDANTRSVIIYCDLYNNAGGHIEYNGQKGHLYKTSNSGFVYLPGSEIRIDKDASYAAYLRFFHNGVADVRMNVASSSDAIAITNSGGTEIYKFATSGVFEVMAAAGYARFRDGAYIEFFQSSAAKSTIKCGTGSPEGATTSNIGSLWLQRDGAGTLWRKENGTGNTGWRAVITNAVSADKGDAAVTLTVGTDEHTVIYNTPISADRAITLSTTGAYNGAKFRVVRTAACTGAFNINVGTGPLKAMGTAGSFCDVEYNGSSWILTAYGTL